MYLFQLIAVSVQWNFQAAAVLNIYVSKLVSAFIVRQLPWRLVFRPALNEERQPLLDTTSAASCMQVAPILFPIVWQIENSLFSFSCHQHLSNLQSNNVPPTAIKAKAIGNFHVVWAARRGDNRIFVWTLILFIFPASNCNMIAHVTVWT